MNAHNARSEGDEPLNGDTKDEKESSRFSIVAGIRRLLFPKLSSDSGFSELTSRSLNRSNLLSGGPSLTYTPMPAREKAHLDRALGKEGDPIKELFDVKSYVESEGDYKTGQEIGRLISEVTKIVAEKDIPEYERLAASNRLLKESEYLERTKKYIAAGTRIYNRMD